MLFPKFQVFTVKNNSGIISPSCGIILSLSIWLRGERLPLDQPVIGLIPLLPLPKEKSVPAGIGIGLPPHNKPHELMGPS